MSSLPTQRWLAACLCCAVAPIAGCCAISRLSPCDENEVAARELARSGLEALHRGELGEAHVRFSHALDKCPHNPEARHHLAELLWKKGDRRRAIQEMEAAVRDSGDNPLWTVEHGQMLLADGGHDGALDCADRALRSAPNLASGWLLRGDVKRSRNEHEEAKQAYHHSLVGAEDGSTEMISAVLNLAELYRLEGRPLRALASLERLEASVDWVEQEAAKRIEAKLPYEQAIALHALGRFEAAMEKFQRARQHLGDDPDLLMMLADCQFRAGEYDAAHATTALLTTVAPNDDRVAALQANLKSVGQRFAGPL